MVRLSDISFPISVFGAGEDLGVGANVGNAVLRWGEANDENARAEPPGPAHHWRSAARLLCTKSGEQQSWCPGALAARAVYRWAYVLGRAGALHGNNARADPVRPGHHDLQQLPAAGAEYPADAGLSIVSFKPPRSRIWDRGWG